MCKEHTLDFTSLNWSQMIWKVVKIAYKIWRDLHLKSVWVQVVGVISGYITLSVTSYSS